MTMRPYKAGAIWTGGRKSAPAGDTIAPTLPPGGIHPARPTMNTMSETNITAVITPYPGAGVWWSVVGAGSHTCPRGCDGSAVGVVRQRPANQSRAHDHAPLHDVTDVAGGDVCRRARTSASARHRPDVTPTIVANRALVEATVALSPVGAGYIPPAHWT